MEKSGAAQRVFANAYTPTACSCVKSVKAKMDSLVQEQKHYVMNNIAATIQLGSCVVCELESTNS